MCLEKWTDLRPLVQNAQNSAPSPSLGYIKPITAFMGTEHTPPSSTFLRTETAESITITEADRERMLNIQALKVRVAELHLLVQASVQKNRERSRPAASTGQPPNFTDEDYVLVDRKKLFVRKKLCLRRRGPRRIIEARSDFVYKMEDLRIDQLEEIYGSRL